MKRSYRIEVKARCRDRFRCFIEAGFSAVKLRTARVLCFPGQQALEIFEVYDRLGIHRENIVCLEKGRRAYNELKRRNLGVRLVQQKLEEFIEKPPEHKFDIVSLDFTGQLGTYENVIYRLRMRGFLDDHSIVLTNFCGAREADATKGYYAWARRTDAAGMEPDEWYRILNKFRDAMGNPEKTRAAWRELGKRPLKPYWEETLKEQRDLALHPIVRDALTKPRPCTLHLMFRYCDRDGSLTRETRMWLEAKYLTMVDGITPEIIREVRRGQKATLRQDDSMHPMIAARLLERLSKLETQIVQKFVKRQKHGSTLIDELQNVLGVSLNVCLGTGYVVLAAESYKYVSDKGTPMYADFFRLRRLDECDCLFELIPRNPGTLEEVFDPIKRLTRPAFRECMQTLLVQSRLALSAMQSQPPPPTRVELGRESLLNPGNPSLRLDDEQKRKLALDKLIASPGLTIEDVALEVDAKRMQVAAWKAHFTMGTYADESQTSLIAMAERALSQERYPEALELYARLARREPRSVTVLRNYSRVLRKMGREGMALAIVANALELMPGDAALLEERATCLAALGRIGEAVGELELAHKRSPKNAAVLVGLGDAFRRQELHDDAVRYYEDALAVDPTSFAARLGKGICLSEKGERAASLAEFDELVRLHPNSADAYYNRSVVHRKLGDQQALFHDLRQTCRLSPTHVPALFNTGMLAFSLGAHDIAREMLSLVVQIDPENALAFDRLAAACMKAGRHADAVEALTQGLKQHPQSNDLLSRQASALLAMGRTREALEVADRLVKRDPDSPECHTLRGRILLQAERFREAVDQFEQAYQLDSGCREAWLGQAVALTGAGRMNDALELLTRMLVFWPFDVDVLARKSTLLIYMNRLEEANVAVESALRTCPTHAAALGNRGRILCAEGKLVEALQCYEQALEQDPDLADVLFDKARLLFATDRFAEALGALDKYLALDSEDTEAYCMRALAKVPLDDPMGARQDLVTALRKARDRASAKKYRDLIGMLDAEFGRVTPNT